MSKLYIAMYHYVRDLEHSRYPDIKGMQVNDFRKQLEFLKSNFNPVRMEDVISTVKCGKELPNNSVLLTFDDGYTDNYTYAFPILDEMGLQGSFFIPGKTFTTHTLLDVNKIHYILASADIMELVKDVLDKMNYYRGTEYSYPSNDELWEEHAVANRLDCKETIFVKRMLQTVLPEKLRNRISSDLFEKYVGISEEKLAYELYMTEDQIMTMKRHGMYIGVHGYDHYWLNNLPIEEMHQDIDRALEVMEPFIDKDNWVMNYPYGEYSDAVVDYAKSKGACIGLTTDVRVADIGVDNPMLLPRLDCIDFPPRSDNYKGF